MIIDNEKNLSNFTVIDNECLDGAIAYYWVRYGAVLVSRTSTQIHRLTISSC
jgi:hypothetical protein